jgi:hypothetical protein
MIERFRDPGIYGVLDSLQRRQQHVFYLQFSLTSYVA